MKRAVIRVHLEEQPEGGYTVTSPDVPELITEGETIAECLENAQEVAQLLYETYQEQGWAIPEAFREIPPMPQIDVAITVGLG